MSIFADDDNEDTQPIVLTPFCPERVVRAAESCLHVLAVDCPRCRAPQDSACCEPDGRLDDGALHLTLEEVAPFGAYYDLDAALDGERAEEGEVAAFQRALRPGPVGWLMRLRFEVGAALGRWCERAADEDDEVDDAGVRVAAAMTLPS